jgi:glycosyltransferase involved in cell wall biosynthesis
MTLERPLVSCIMATRDRPPLAEQAIRSFLRQSYPAKELIVVDDGDQPPHLPESEQIRHLRLRERRTLGARWNLACRESRGELLALWIDDAWQAPDRLARQVEAIHRSGADAAGQRDLTYYAPFEGVGWIKRGPVDSAPYAADPSLLFRRIAWEQSPFVEADPPGFPPASSQLAIERVATIADPPLTIATMHRGNPEGHNLLDPRWLRCPVDAIESALAGDWAFFAELRSGRRYAPAPPPAPEPLTLRANFMIADGYGSMAEYLALGLERAGVELNVVPYRLVRDGLSARLLELIAAAHPDPTAPLLHHCTVDAGTPFFPKSRDLFISTMWESDRLPSGWLPALHRARSVIVPTRWCARVFRDNGIRGPIDVVPDGVDPAVYHYAPPPQREGLTTLIVGTNSDRKHIREGVAAWKQAFAGDRAARLLLKSHHQYRGYVPDDPRIAYVDVNEATRGITHWYRQADVLMALGNEGFGLPLIEAMACGLPAIALSTEGQGDVCQDANGLLLPIPGAGWEPNILAPYGHCGQRAIPSVEAAAAQLRWVAAHRDEAAAMGKAASRWTLTHRNVWSKAPAVLQIVERWLDPPRSLSRRQPAPKPKTRIPEPVGTAS